MSPTVSNEFERILVCGNSARLTIFGDFGSLTSTAVKFIGALSCANHRMRRPSLATCIDMPSPMPPNPSSVLFDNRRKFQLIVSVAAIAFLPWSLCCPGLFAARLRIAVEVFLDRATGQLRDGTHRGARYAPHRVVLVSGAQLDTAGAGTRGIADGNIPIAAGFLLRLELKLAAGQLD